MQAQQFVAIWFIFMIFGILFALLVTALTIVAWWKILSKLGYNGALSLLMLLPFVNIILPLYYAFIEWPIEKELKQLKSQGVQSPPPPMP